MESDKPQYTDGSLTLFSGRSITIDELIQFRTYGGLMEGTPDEEANDLCIEWALDRARKSSVENGEPFLIAPDRRVYDKIPGDMDAIIEFKKQRPKGFQRLPEFMPDVTSIGIFRSVRPARDSDKDGSSLTVVWYQSGFGFDHATVERLRALDWENLAVDWEY